MSQDEKQENKNSCSLKIEFIESELVSFIKTIYSHIGEKLLVSELD